MELANRGLEGACEKSNAIREGVNTYKGHVVYQAVAESQGKTWKELSTVM
jgi:alanine dehydrogenase